MSASFHRPSDLRGLVLTMQSKCRSGTLTNADVIRWCEQIEANADEWERERRVKACLPLLGKLGLTIEKQAPEITGR